MTLPSGTFLYLVGDIPDTADDRVAPRTFEHAQSKKRLCLRTRVRGQSGNTVVS